MIDARELRLGNYVLVDGVIKEIFGIGPAGVDFVVATPSKSVKIDGCIYEHLCPIPLSAAILEGCGFESDRHENLSKEVGNGYTLATFKSGRHGVGLYDEDGYWTGFSFDTLHRLQNLWYSLTGEELAVDPKKL